MDLKQALANDHLVHQQWARFIRGKKTDRSIVRSVILKGWEMFKDKKLDPFSNNIIMVPESELRRLMEESKDLIDCADSVLKNLFCGEMTSTTNIILSNAQGVILYKLEAQSKDGNCTPNSIGCTTSQGILTCLMEKQSINIIGSEHYCQPQQHFCCHTTPIFGRHNQVVGALSLGVAKSHSHFLVETLMESAAASIGEQLRLRELLEEHDVLMELFDSGIIILDGNGIIRTCNSKARSFFHFEDSPVGRHLKYFFEENHFVKALLVEHLIVQEQKTDFILRKSGRHISCLLSTSRLLSGNYFILHISQAEVVQESVSLSASSEYITFADIVGESEAFRKTVRLARQVAGTDITTLLLGESGTGKDLFAQAMHMASTRASKPFISVNCGAIPKDLLQSTLFGYEAGAFTGASRKGHPGIFEQADKGTLFLDEIAEMPLEDQTSLLRVLQNREVTRLGGTKKYKVDVRVITATNRNLPEAVRKKLFREDLYYRLNVFPISLPPLRERPEDIELLASFFFRRFQRELPDPPSGISPEVMRCFRAYSWPGNVRELKNLMERLMNLVGRKTIQLEDLPEPFLSLAGQSVPRPVFPSQEDLPPAGEIQKALLQTRGNVKNAAQILHISRGGLYYKMKSLNINPRDFRSSSMTKISKENTFEHKDGKLLHADELLLNSFSKEQLHTLYNILREHEEG